MAFTRKKTEFVNILEGKENIKIDELMKKFPKGIHITGASVIKAKKGDCSAFTFEEDETKFFFGGVCFTDSVKKWISEHGSVQAMNTALATDKPLMVISAHESKNGNTYYDFEM